MKNSLQRLRNPGLKNMFKPTFGCVLPSQLAQNDGTEKKKKEKEKTHYENIKICYTKNSIVASKIIWPASS